MEDGMLPELTEEEMFGEASEDVDGSGAAEDMETPKETPPESAESPEADTPAAKTRRTTRSKKEKTPEGNGGETKETDTEMKETPEAVSDGVPDFPDAAAASDTDGPAEHATDGAEKPFFRKIRLLLKQDRKERFYPSAQMVLKVPFLLLLLPGVLQPEAGKRMLLC